MNYANPFFAVVFLAVTPMFLLPVLSQTEPKLEERIIVTGRVVDLFGRPMGGAYVWLYWQCRSCPDQLFPGQYAGEQGGFYLVTDPVKGGILLFVNPPVPNNAWSPLSYFTEEERRPLTIMRGIRMPRKKTIDLGDVRTPFEYATLLIDLRTLSDEVAETFRAPVYLKIHAGKITDRGYVPDPVLKDHPGFLRLALPVGTKPLNWTVELSHSEERTGELLKLAVKLSAGECQKVGRDGGKISISKCRSDED